jgi:hypothetical protein
MIILPHRVCRLLSAALFCASVSFLLGCTHSGVRQVTAPNGTAALHVSCPRDAGRCYELAGQHCPRGYQIAPAYGPQASSFLVQCWDYQSQSQYAAQTQYQPQAYQQAPAPAPQKSYPPATPWPPQVDPAQPTQPWQEGSAPAQSSNPGTRGSAPPAGSPTSPQLSPDLKEYDVGY